METQFELKSLKFDAANCVDCKYIFRTTVDEETTEQEFHVKDARLAHPDFLDLFTKDLSNILCRILRVTDDNPPVYAIGISFAGKGENIGIRIIGEWHTKFGTVVVKTPRIKYKAGSHEVDAELTKFAEAVEEEAANYLFNDKVGTYGTFGE